jgi:hypothetical protein
MGLDVYVGPLTRYYTGQWETIVQQVFKGSGIPVRIIRPNKPKRGWFRTLFDPVDPRSPDAVARSIRDWRNRLRRELKTPDLDWNEEPDAAYMTDKPAWDCYGALILWAAYEESPNAKRRGTADGWNSDPAYIAACSNTHSRYQHLIANTEIWLPADLPVPVQASTIIGNTVRVGSSIRLLSELRELNSLTWNASDPQVSQWRQHGAEYRGPLETSARFGFSVFYKLAKYSVAARLPMILDY